MSERSASATVLTISSPQNALTTLAQPSLKSKRVGSPGSSSDASTNGDGRVSDTDIVETVRTPHAEEHEKHKNKKLKSGAETARARPTLLCVLISSPRSSMVPVCYSVVFIKVVSRVYSGLHIDSNSALQ